MICEIPKGIIAIAETDKKIPALELLYMKSHSGLPRAMNVESKMDENTIASLMAKLIFDLIKVLSVSLPLSILFDCSLIDGMMVVANEPMRVEGIITRGKVIPIIIPYSDRASVDEYPYVMSLIGIKTEIMEETIEDTVFAAVIGELDFNSALSCVFGLESVPPFLKYSTAICIVEIMHAIESDRAVLFVAEILINEVLNKIIITISLITCSKNSLKLIAKNCCCPQSAPLKTS